MINIKQFNLEIFFPKTVLDKLSYVEKLVLKELFEKSFSTIKTEKDLNSFVDSLKNIFFKLFSHEIEKSMENLFNELSQNNEVKGINCPICGRHDFGLYDACPHCEKHKFKKPWFDDLKDEYKK